MSKRFGRHIANAQLTAGFMEQGVGNQLTQLLCEGIEIGFDREDADRAAVVIPMRVVMVVHQLQMPYALAAGNATGQRTQPAHATVR